MRRKSSSTEPWSGYQFLNFSHPAEAKDQRTRRAVRSHVTRKQHQKEGRGPAAAEAPRSYSMPELFPQDPLPCFHGPHPPYLAMTVESVKEEHLGVSINSFETSSSDVSPISAGSPLSPNSSNFPLRVLDPTQIYPVEWHPFISIALDTYMSSLAYDILNANDTATMEVLRNCWMPFILTDPALLHSTLLVAAAIFGSHPGPRAHTIDILQLKGMAIRAINEALVDPFQSDSDQLIGAVAAMAQFEAFWGDNDPEAYKSHMHGLIHLVRHRGGLETLGLNGFLERLLLSIDYHASRVNGVETFFGSPNLHQQHNSQ